jgi:hypothetical protein
MNGGTSFSYLYGDYPFHLFPYWLYLMPEVSNSSDIFLLKAPFGKLPSRKLSAGTHSI